MAVQKQYAHLELTYSSSVRIRDVAMGTYRKRSTIGRGGERESGISMLMTRQDDDFTTKFADPNVLRIYFLGRIFSLDSHR